MLSLPDVCKLKDSQIDLRSILSSIFILAMLYEYGYRIKYDEGMLI
jgi:hypothetical protein